MKFIPKHTHEIRAMFDSYLKTCLRNEACNMENAQKRLNEREVLFTDLSSRYIENLPANYEYSIFSDVFQVLHYSVTVENDRLSEALRLLPNQKRTIILLHYFLDMSDLEISTLTHTRQEQVKKTRQRTLTDLRKNMEDTNDQN